MDLLTVFLIPIAVSSVLLLITGLSVRKDERRRARLRKEPERAETGKPDPEVQRKPEVKEEKKPPEDRKAAPPKQPEKDLPRCCAKCGAELTEGSCGACGFDHKRETIRYLCHPRFSE